MHIQFKSFISLLRRYPLPILGNVMGLSVAIAAFLITSMEVEYNRNYDRKLKDVDRLYQVFREVDTGVYGNSFNRPTCEEIATASPHISSATFRNSYHTEVVVVKLNDMDWKLYMVRAASNYFDTFGFDWLACDTTTFADPWAVFLPESVALRVYGTTDLVRKPANPQAQNGAYIGGIYRDFPENSSVINAVYCYMGNENKGVYQNWNYHCFVRLTDAECKTDVEAALSKMNDDETNLVLVPYAELHFRPDMPQEKITVTISPDALYLFLCLALAVIIIACINFTNLYVALCPLRIRSINTRKVLGLTRGELVRALAAETTFIGFIAWLVALGLVVLAAELGIGQLQHASVSLSAHPLLTGFSLGLALLMGFVSGIYPALYATSFQPALVLKGNFGLSPKGRSMRNLLIGLQFTTAFALLICVFNVWQQNDYMRHSELGYNQNRLVDISTSGIWRS